MDNKYTLNVNCNHNLQYDPKYIYKNNAELLILLEKDFQENAEEIYLMYNSNKEMLLYDNKDYDLIQAVNDNNIIINKRLEIINYIKMRIKNIKPSHPLVDIDVLKLLNINLKSSFIDVINNELNKNKIDNSNNSNNNNTSEKSNNINNNNNTNEDIDMLSCKSMINDIDL